MVKNSLSMPSLGFNISAFSFGHSPKKQQTVVQTLIQNSFCVTKHDEELKKALHIADILLPDCIAIVQE
jgi:UDP-N-acetyl-D-mannosaminuronic acid transferase (WecB/TagA/CpsF family)